MLEFPCSPKYAQTVAAFTVGYTQLPVYYEDRNRTEPLEDYESFLTADSYNPFA